MGSLSALNTPAGTWPEILAVLHLKGPTFPLFALKGKYSLLADMWSRHQLLDEVVQPHFSLLDEGCRWREKRGLQSKCVRGKQKPIRSYVIQIFFFCPFNKMFCVTALIRWGFFCLVFFEVHASCYRVDLRVAHRALMLRGL